MDMRTTAFVPRVLALISAIARTPLWVTIVAAVSTLTLVAVALTLFSDGMSSEGLNSGRMAFSFVALLTLAFVLFTTPAITDRVRDQIGAKGVIDSLVIALTVAGSLVLAAVPAGAWAVLATGVDFSVWLPAVGAVAIEILVVVALVGVSFGTIARTGVATAVAYSAISSLIVIPLLTLSAVACMPGIEQRVTVRQMDWPEDQNEMDPATGYPRNPVCNSSRVDTQMFPAYNRVWAVAPIVPFTLVSEAVAPEVVEWEATNYGSTYAESAPVDLFSTLALTSRQMQLPIETKLSINECDALEETGEPYVDYYSGPSDKTVLESTDSGFAAGLLGQGVIMSAWIAGMLIVPRLRRRP